MRTVRAAAVLTLILVFAGCHNQPVIDTGPKPPNVGGTISGNATGVGGTALSARKVTAIETTTGARYVESTATNGGYTIKVPKGTYRLELELRPGEALSKEPEPTKVDVGDLDGQRDFVVTAGR
jgi:hypothetical protein